MNAIQKATENNAAKAGKSINGIMSAILDGEKMRKRFDDLLGDRSAQFISSIVSLVNATPQLQQAMYEAPMTVIQSALKAATYDLPIDPGLGYAYIVPFKNKQPDGSFRNEAAFILGYRGMLQLALRTGAYKTINVTDVREGELKSYNRLTEEIELEFIEDEDKREATPVVGYVGYFKLINGSEKTIYMTKKQVEAHEKKNRKGKYMTKGWREDFEAMALKTVYRRLIGKYGLMSIDYRTADAHTVAAAQAIASGQFDADDENTPEYVADVEYVDVDDSPDGGPSLDAEEAQEADPASMI